MFANKITRFHKVLKPASELILSLVAGFGDPKDWKIKSEEAKILLKVSEELKKDMIPNIKNPADQERFFRMVNGAFVILMLLCEEETFYCSQIRNAMIKVRDHTQGLKVKEL